MLYREINYNCFKNHLTHTNHNVLFPYVLVRGINNQQWPLAR
jgi:adenine C2-methylase RlmN of 23S rRNA A2503 and tRNA A37